MNYSAVAAEAVAGHRAVPLTPRYRAPPEPERDEPDERLDLVPPSPASAHAAGPTAQVSGNRPSVRARQADSGMGAMEARYFGLDLSTPRDSQGNPTRVPVIAR